VQNKNKNKILYIYIYIYIYTLQAVNFDRQEETLENYSLRILRTDYIKEHNKAKIFLIHTWEEKRQEKDRNTGKGVIGAHMGFELEC
jgi:hypothetical protein